MKSPSDQPINVVEPLTANRWRWWKTRLVARGPWVPCLLEWHEETDPETGELVADVEYYAEIDGRPVDPHDVPGWEYWRPIEQDEWDVLTFDAALRNGGDHE